GQYTIIPGDPDGPQERRPSVFVYPTTQESLVKELGQGTAKRLRAEYEYDHFGNLTETREYDAVDDGAKPAPVLLRTVQRQYAQNFDAWLIGCVSKVVTLDETGAPLLRSENYYDDETFAGNNLGAVSQGDLTLVRVWGDPGDDATSIPDTRSKYDVYGNVTVFIDSLAVAPGGVLDTAQGHYRTVAYDTSFHTWPIQETVELGGGRNPLLFKAGYDYGLGRVTVTNDFNRFSTTYHYDPFGLLSWLVKPGDSDAYPTLEYEYVRGQVDPASGKTISYVETRLLDVAPGSADTKPAHYFISRAYADGLGRPLMNKEEAEPDPVTGAARAAVAQACIYGPRGVMIASVNPYYSANAPGEELAFEDLGSDAWRGVFHVFDDGDSLPAQLEARSLADAPKTQYVYDASLRAIRRIAPDGSQSETKFEPLETQSFDAHDTDPQSPFYGTPTVQYSDGLGRLVQLDEMVRLNDDGTPADSLKTWSTRYAYRADNLLLSVTDSQGNVRSTVYDGFGMPVSVNDLDRGVTQFVFDNMSNLIETVDAKGQRITWTYDGANRLLTTDYHDEAMPYSSGRAYDPSQPISEDNKPDLL
ncbi:MAG: TcdB toxin midN protein, partial [Candidatus Hydrogenedentes bacterium]|nr:TcdB toxin midN protein [Candidatus Hydrogenedentota bacterium]